MRNSYHKGAQTFLSGKEPKHSQSKKQAFRILYGDRLEMIRALPFRGPKRDGSDIGKLDDFPFILSSLNRVAVGTALAGGPPHRSVHEELPHTAPTSGR